MSKSKVIGESDPSSSSSHRSTFNLSQYGKSIKRIRRSSSESSSSESDSKDDYKQQRKKNHKEQSDIQSKQTSNSLPIQSTLAEPLHTVGAYIPPAKLRLLQASLTDKSTSEYQRLSWESLEESINGQINQVNSSNLSSIIRELFKENIVNGRGLLARAIIRSQRASLSDTSVYAALVSVINSKFPQIGELIIKRLISSLYRAYVTSDKKKCLATTKFLAHLVNQNILHEIVALQILGLFLETPYLTNDKVQLGIGFLKECGQKLCEVSPRGLNPIFSTLRDSLHDLSLDQHTQSTIEVLFTLRKDQFKAYPSIPAGLDLVDENEQYTHIIPLDSEYETEPMLDVFSFDEQYEKNERKYKQIRKRILDESSDDEYESSGNFSSNDDEDDQKKNDVNEEEQTFDDEEKEKEEIIIDQTEINLVTLRETICSIIESSISPDECADELLRMNVRPGLGSEVCQMILDTCAQKQAYERFFGFLAERCCSLKKEYRQSFEKIFRNQYEIAHRLESFRL